MSDQSSNAIYLRCGSCASVWKLADLPIDVSELVKRTKETRCPGDGFRGRRHYIITSEHPDHPDHPTYVKVQDLFQTLSNADKKLPEGY